MTWPGVVAAHGLTVEIERDGDALGMVIRCACGFTEHTTDDELPVARLEELEASHREAVAELDSFTGHLLAGHVTRARRGAVWLMVCDCGVTWPVDVVVGR